jgi:hypothetical protein
LPRGFKLNVMYVRFAMEKAAFLQHLPKIFPYSRRSADLPAIKDHSPRLYTCLCAMCVFARLIQYFLVNVGRKEIPLQSVVFQSNDKDIFSVMHGILRFLELIY